MIETLKTVPKSESFFGTVQLNNCIRLPGRLFLTHGLTGEISIMLEKKALNVDVETNVWMVKVSGKTTSYIIPDQRVFGIIAHDNSVRSWAYHRVK